MKLSYDDFFSYMKTFRTGVFHGTVDVICEDPVLKPTTVYRFNLEFKVISAN